VITFIPEYLRMAREYEPIITSAAIIVIIIFMPMGILGLLDARVKPWLVRLGLMRPERGSKDVVTSQ
jgi:hypothetical protein